MSAMRSMWRLSLGSQRRKRAERRAKNAGQISASETSSCKGGSKSARDAAQMQAGGESGKSTTPMLRPRTKALIKLMIQGPSSSLSWLAKRKPNKFEFQMTEKKIVESDGEALRVVRHYVKTMSVTQIGTAQRAAASYEDAKRYVVGAPQYSSQFCNLCGPHS